MAKANINSGLQQIPNNNSGRLFFSTSTVENENKLQHVRIYERINEDEYNKIKLDDVKDSQGVCERRIRTEEERTTRD